jgi:antitoxin (DNA-binding transcriptional repressor) of toxin-antitoxin stability system
MTVENTPAAKTHLSKLIEKVLQEEEVIISKGANRSPGWCRLRRSAGPSPTAR